ncbi:PotD/PotF family extracellular solute-binding protein [Thalassospira sp.]|uniref:ABC transporter substrate-binding protein n=1 Tax=Thalassospira sp. TaxID=1912094 RepID=UPI00273705EC|nr:extracellular solute-binding protein [Thalassospira sp.]MDP2699515.1 extracellular solute-binding protein [Thalassospira sp.]
MEIVKTGVSRRKVLAGLAGGSALAVAGISGFPGILRAQTKTLKIGTYGGYFKDSFDTHIFPEFTKATGIDVESIAQPTGEAWLVQLEQAARAGQAPADVSMIAQASMLRGASAGIWAVLDAAKMPNLANVKPAFINKYADGGVCGVGAVTWYITLVSNTDVIAETPTSWAELWKPERKQQLGLLALASNSFLLDITAKTHFGGQEILDTEDGILQVMDKIAELKDNVQLWYRDEAQFEQALKSGEIPMGQYYHDVAGLAAADGYPVRSTFPQEGGINDAGSWAVSKASDQLDLAHVFIDFMSQPSIQSLLSRKVGTSPTIDRAATDLTDDEFASVSSEIDPIIPRYDIYLEKGDWLAQKWTELIVG